MRVENGFYVWKKGFVGKLSDHFTCREFECRCSYSDCTESRISVDYMSNLEKARVEYGSPIKVTSGYRCLKHNRDIGSSDTSQHVLGNAADTVPKDFTTESLDNWIKVVRKYFKSIGLAVNFVHTDGRTDNSREWVY